MLEIWLELDAQYGSKLFLEGIEDLIETKVIIFPSATTLLHLPNLAIDQTALWVAKSKQPKQSNKEVREALIDV